MIIHEYVLYFIILMHDYLEWISSYNSFFTQNVYIPWLLIAEWWVIQNITYKNFSLLIFSMHLDFIDVKTRDRATASAINDHWVSSINKVQLNKCIFAWR